MTQCQLQEKISENRFFCGKSISEISEIELFDLDNIHYFQLDQEEDWKIEMFKYLLDEKSEHPLNHEENKWLKYLGTA